MIPIPWKENLYPHMVNFKTLPYPTQGFLILRPLYGNMGAPLRWLARLSKCLIRLGVRRTQSDICTYAKLDPNGNICGFVIANAGGLLSAGNFGFLVVVKKQFLCFE